LKKSFLALGIFGILLILFGTGFALQGDGILGGSAMSGNPFWIYAGAGVVVVGLVLAGLGFYFGSKSKTRASPKMEENKGSETAASSDASTSSQNKKLS
jgi:hypothetical protein